MKCSVNIFFHLSKQKWYVPKDQELPSIWSLIAYFVSKSKVMLIAKSSTRIIEVLRDEIWTLYNQTQSLCSVTAMADIDGTLVVSCNGKDIL
jgi:hypothetical protein